jgi:hypothetical protein
MLKLSSSLDWPTSAKLDAGYFLELYGETSPLVDPDCAQVLASRGKETAGPIYEYFWTLGRYGLHGEGQEDDEELRRAPRTGLRRRLPFQSGQPHSWGDFTKGTSAQVRVLFPRSRGWRVHELAVSVKYLAPVPEQKSLLENVDRDIGALQPFLGVAGTVAGAAGAVGAGPVASATGHVLDAVAKMKVNSVPQAPKFEWSVEKITTWVADPEGKELVDGIAWNLPQSMFEQLGSRVNGSIAVSFVPLSTHNSTETATPKPLPGIVRARAVLPLKPKQIHIPEDDFVRLNVHPVEPDVPAGDP